MITTLGKVTRAFRTSWVVAGLLVSVPVAATAQDYPNKVIRVVVPYAAGGAIDLTARIVVERLEPLLGQPVIIENRPGAAGRIAAEYVARAEPDGYTLVYTAGADLTVLQNRPGVPEQVRRLTPIAAAVNPVAAIAMRTGLNIESMSDLLAYIKANPGKLTYGSIGPGSIQHLYGEYFKQAGYDMLQVPFNGMSPMMTALAGGQIDVAITNLAISLPLTSDGKIKTLAVTQSESFEGAPDIPPITKAMPGFPFPKPFFGYYGPPGLPRPIVSKVSDAIGKVLAMPEVKARLAKFSIDPLVTTPEQFEAMVQETATTLQKIIKAADIQLQ